MEKVKKRVYVVDNSVNCRLSFLFKLEEDTLLKVWAKGKKVIILIQLSIASLNSPHTSLSLLPITLNFYSQLSLFKLLKLFIRV